MIATPAPATPSPLPQRALDSASFALLALALWLPSGYSIGAVALLALGLTRLPALLTGGAPRSSADTAWALVIVLMGAVWAMHIVDPNGRLITNSLGLDRCIKYALALLALPALWGPQPRAAALRWGCWVGATGAGVLALWQVLVQLQARADGHTNAIQFGNLALLLAVWSLIWALQTPDRRARALGALAALAGLAASLASGSRGGWLTLPLLLGLGLWLASATPARPRWRGAQALGATLLACALLAALPPVQQRVALAVQELQDHQPQRDNTSTGLRLAFWQQAWAFGQSQPWIGIGQSAYESRQREAVARHQMPDQAVEFNHAHNEWLDMFAKRGLLGCAGLALFYGVPGVLFWRRLRRPGVTAPGEPATLASARHAANLCGLTTVLGFIGFGMTQVMFAHNNGNLMYLLCISVWLAAGRAPQERRA